MAKFNTPITLKSEEQSKYFKGLSKAEENAIFSQIDSLPISQYEKNLKADSMYKEMLNKKKHTQFVNDRMEATNEINERAASSKDHVEAKSLQSQGKFGQLADMVRNLMYEKEGMNLDNFKDEDVITAFLKDNPDMVTQFDSFMNGDQTAESFASRNGFDYDEIDKAVDQVFGANGTTASYMNQQSEGEWNDEFFGRLDTEGLDQGASVKGFLKNLAKSTWNVVADVGNMVVNPLDTVNALAKTAVGAGMNVLGLDDNVEGEEGWLAEANQVADGLGDFLKERYGGKQEILNTLYSDPAGLISDIASIATGGAGAVKGIAGGIAKGAAKAGLKSTARTASNVSKVAGKVMNIADKADPYTRAMDTYKWAGKGALTYGGKGVEKIKENFNIDNFVGLDSKTKKNIQDNPYAAEAWEKAQNYIEENGLPDKSQRVSKDLMEGVVKEVQTEINKLKDQLGETSPEYKKLKESGAEVSFYDINNRIDEILTDAGVQKTKKGGLDFSKTAITPTEASAIRRIYNWAKDTDTMDITEYMRYRKSIDQLGLWEDAKGTPGKNIIKQIREAGNEVAHEQVEPLKLLDQQYSDRAKALDKVTEGIVYREKRKAGQIKDNINQILKNLDEPNRRMLSQRLQEILPGVEEKVRAINMLPKLIDNYYRHDHAADIMKSFGMGGGVIGGVVGGGIPGAIVGTVGGYLLGKGFNKLKQARWEKAMGKLSEAGQQKLSEISEKIQAKEELSNFEKNYVKAIGKQIEEGNFKENQVSSKTATNQETFNNIADAIADINNEEAKYTDADIKLIESVLEESKKELSEQDYKLLKQVLEDQKSDWEIAKGEKEFMEKDAQKIINNEDAQAVKDFQSRILKIENEEKNVGKVAGKKVNRAYAEQQQRNLETKREKLIEEIGEYYGLDQYEAANKYDELRDSANVNKAKYQTVYHGSPYSFDKFDSSHMGEGEGAQAHGWGHYVAVEERTGKHYAELNNREQHTYKGKIRDQLYGKDIKPDEAVATIIMNWMDQGKSYKEAFNLVKENLEYGIELLQKHIDKDERALQGYRSLEDAEGILERSKTQLKSMDKLKESDFSFGKNRNLYNVEIPDPKKADTPTGKNYIEEAGEITKSQLEKIYESLVKEYDKQKSGKPKWVNNLQDGKLNEFRNKIDVDNIKNGYDLYRGLSRVLGGDKNASKFLESLGYDGIHYIGGRDGEAYVIFNDNALDITNHEKYQKYGTAKANEKNISAEEGLNLKDFRNGRTVQEIADQYGVSTNIVDRILTPEGQRALGVYQNGGIELAKTIKESTAPHELLHATFDLVDNSRKSEILNNIQKRLNVDEIQAEEWLADNFSEYYRTGKFDTKAIPTTLVGKIKQFFQQVKEFVDGTYAERKQIQNLFDDILDGKDLEGGKGSKSVFQSAGDIYSNNFKNWFGDWENDPKNASKVVNEDGTPRIMYHGTEKGGFTIFDTSIDRPRKKDRQGYYFSADKKYSETFQGINRKTGEYYDSVKERIENGTANPQMYEVYLDVKNPLILKADEVDLIEDIGYWDNIYDQVKAGGYDGVMMDDMSQVYVFDKNQIKSATDNIGTFDKNNPDIRFQKYGTAGEGEKGVNAIQGLNIRNFKNGKSVKELADNYGIKTHIVQSISTPEGQKAYGMYGDRVITLAKDLKESTVPHELLHATFDMVDQGKKNQILDGIKNRLKVDEIQAEEWLADNFSEYYRTGKFDTKSIPTTFVGQIKQFFQQIKEYIDGTYANRKEIQNLFDDIIDGKLEGEYGVYSDPKFQSVWHGSPAAFEKFDSSHMGEGEGAQAHGWGHYVAVNKETGERYANMRGSGEASYKGKTRQSIKDMAGLQTQEENMALGIMARMEEWGKTFEDARDSMIKDNEGYIKKLEQQIDKKDISWYGSLDYMKEKLKEAKDEIEILNRLDKKDFSKTKRNLYKLDIPDPIKKDTPTGSNYLDEFRYIDEDTIAKFNLALQKVDGEKALDFAIALDKLKTADGTTNVYGGQIYNQLAEVFGSDKKASKFLESLGYDGIHYFGGRDGEAYVIFNDDALKINSHKQY